MLTKHGASYYEPPNVPSPWVPHQLNVMIKRALLTAVATAGLTADAEAVLVVRAVRMAVAHDST